MDEIKEMKCNRCKVLLPIKKFSLNRAEKYLKSCDECRIYQKKERKRYKCEHNRERSRCKECGGSGICEHNKRRSMCKECEGSGICEHNKRRSTCKECDLGGYINHIVSTRVREALKSNKSLRSIKYLGCPIDVFKKHIEEQFTAGMLWVNHGEWHIDHIIPVKYKVDGVVPTFEEICKRLHYTNTQPLWASDNIAKGNKFIG